MHTRFLLFLLPALWLSGASAKVVDEPAELRDLYYGEALYQLYQQNYFTSIVHLLAAEQQGHMQAYDEDPDLLLGGLYLAYGMPDEAQTLFDQVLKEDIAPSIHDRAWLQLAKARYRLEQPGAAITAVSKVGNTLPAEASEERQVLEGLIRLKQGDDAQALVSLSKLQGETEWSHYGSYNRAIALIRTGQTEAGLKLLEEIGTSDIGNPAKGLKDILTSFWGDVAYADESEMKALKDHANLIRGYILLEQKRPAEARTALEKIRVNGLDTNQALLGVGWAALLEEKPQAALPPWQMLARRDAGDQTVLEVMLAIPYALSTLGDDQQALEFYRQGIDRYGDEIDRLNQAVDAIRQGQLLVALQAKLVKDQTNEPNEEAHRLLSLLPLLLSKNNFQSALQDYRDLLFLQSNLETWQEKIADYQTMLVVRQAAYDNKRPIVEAKLAGAELATHQAERDHLQQLLELASSPDEPTFSLASSEEKALLERFEKIDRLIAQIGDRQDLSEQKKTARLLRGTLIWTAVTEHPARAWQARQHLDELDQALAQTHAQQAALQQADQITQGGFGHFSRDIVNLEGQIHGLRSESDRLRRASAEQLQGMAIATLEDRKQLIDNYMIQARFGIATLLDRSSAAGAEGE